ncbi:unnamed protein product [Ectocarpus sp. CCAP 1310/34]|nr:unnamed protein product [Ectocarpus sp. CCAP 1310/34]
MCKRSTLLMLVNQWLLEKNIVLVRPRYGETGRRVECGQGASVMLPAPNVSSSG